MSSHKRNKKNRKRNDERQNKNEQNEYSVENISKEKDQLLVSDSNDHSSTLLNENSEENTEILDPLMKKYNKRKIISNWNKYEETPEAEIEQFRGVDYEVVLSSSGSAISQFRFEDEKDWVEQVKIDANDFTSINCDALSRALQCIPLHERLGIPEGFFMPETVKEFYEDAKVQNESYIQPENIRSSCKDMQQSSIQGDIGGIIESLSSCFNVKKEIKNENKTIKDTVFLDKNEVDDELDFLLSLSEDRRKNITKPHSISSHSATTEMQNKTQENKSKSKASSEINIESWLDSMIED